jgi:anti-anti-sigma factor
VSARPIDPPTPRRLRVIPSAPLADTSADMTADTRADTTADTARAADADDGSWCSCRTNVLPSPGGEIVMLAVDGELDLASLPAVAAALERALDRPTGHLVVSLTGLAFCSVRGAALLVDAGTTAAQHGIGFSVSGAPAQLRRMWAMLFPAERRPVQFATAERALVDIGSRPTRRGAGAPVAAEPAVSAGPPEHLAEPELIAAARSGGAAAYRELVHRTRRRVYRSALHTLSTSDDPDAVAHDIASRLREALAALIAADPR